MFLMKRLTISLLLMNRKAYHSCLFLLKVIIENTLTYVADWGACK